MGRALAVRQSGARGQRQPDAASGDRQHYEHERFGRHADDARSNTLKARTTIGDFGCGYTRTNHRHATGTVFVQTRVPSVAGPWPDFG